MFDAYELTASLTVFQPETAAWPKIWIPGLKTINLIYRLCYLSQFEFLTILPVNRQYEKTFCRASRSGLTHIFWYGR